jgi:gluconate 5-dehydrogenase
MEENLFDIRKKRILITGSSRGLGLTFAEGLGKAGACVILNGRNVERLQKAEETLCSQGIAAHACPFDITDRSQIAAGIERIVGDIGPIDILVNNAGVHKRGSLDALEGKVWDEMIAVNLTGAYQVAQEVVKGMIARKRGKIINICSLMSEIGRPTTGSYMAAKGGLKMLTKAMALDWAIHNIQVNGLAPGYFLTEMTRPLAEDPKFDAWLKARTPAHRWGDPSELIGPLRFLASDASSFVTGQILFVDGGILASL